MCSVVIQTVSLVVALRNTWNDQLITNCDFCFKLDGKKVTPVKKSFGHYVFVGVEKSEFELTIESRDFVGRSVRVVLKDLERLGRVLGLPMIPRYVRKLPLNCVGIYGTADPNAEICAAKITPKSQLRLEEMDEDVIKIKNPMRLNIEGATLAIWSQGQEHFEEFFVLKKKSEEEYIIDRKLKGKHEKGELISKAYLGMAGGQGDYNVFVNCQDDGEFLVKAFKNGSMGFAKAAVPQKTKRVV